MRVASGLDVLRLRDFRLVFGAAVVSLLGDGVAPLALTFAVLDLTGSATALGAVLAVRTVGLVGSLLVGGVVADRFSRRSVMITADLTRLGSQGAVGVLLVSGHVLEALGRFEGRSTLKTWIMRIVANQARTRGEREQRTVPVSALGSDDGEPAVDPSRFRPADDPMYPGGWTLPPQSWAGLPEERLLAGETLQLVRAAIGRLPPRQQEVILLRDVEGWEPEEVSDALGLSAGNQRVLLHRARSKVRDQLESYLGAAA